jgi:hypothetical protein
MWIDPFGMAPRSLPENIAQNLALWRALNPAHKHKLWSLPEVLDLCVEQKRLDVVNAIQQCRFPSMQTDIARLFLLSVCGGFWSDLKLRPRQPLANAFDIHDTVLVEHFPKPELPEPRGMLANGFIGAAPRAPLLVTALALVVRNVEQRQGDGVFLITGPGALTMAWRSFRLADPHRSRAIHVIPHADAWDVLWDVVPDTYNLPGMHWATRQQRESPFMPASLPTRSGDAAGLFQAVPGHRVRIDAINSKRGFHPFEEATSFCWLAGEGASRIFFDAFLPFDRLRLKMYALENYPLPEVVFRVNGQPTHSDIKTDGDGWNTIEVGPLVTQPKWNELAIAPPYFVESPGGDGRRLSVALAWLQPWIGE